MSELSIVNGVMIEDNAEAGIMRFKPVDSTLTDQQPSAESKSWLRRLIDAVKKANVKPYMKVRDLSNPIDNQKDEDIGSAPTPSIEAGIKIIF